MTVRSLIWHFESPANVVYPSVFWETTLGVPGVTTAAATTYIESTPTRFLTFIATSNNKFAHSVDGFNWTLGTLPASAAWRHPGYGNGVLVLPAASTAYMVRTTDSGDTWTAHSMPSSALWRFVRWCNDRFITMAETSNKAAYSFDGASWTATTLPSTAAWYDACSGGGKIVAVASTGVTAVSTDNGATWSAGGTIPGGLTTWISIAYGAGMFVATRSNNGNQYAYSSDGLTWTLGTFPVSGPGYQVRWFGDQFAATFNSTQSLHSFDGVNWTTATAPSTGGIWRGIAEKAGTMVMVANNNATTRTV